MTFYESIQNPSLFVAAATKIQAQNFDALSSSTHWERAASNWSTRHLFACRLICKHHRAVLSILKDEILVTRTKQWNRYINELINGPNEDRATLVQMSEPEIVQAYENNGLLGTVWAALAPLMKEQIPSNLATTEESTRTRNPPVTFAPFVSSSSMQVESSPSEEERPSTGSSQPQSIGYHEHLAAPLLEDNTMHFASSLIRYTINYGQRTGKSLSYVQYRDERLRHKDSGGSWEAIDDGGMHIIQESRNNRIQVALLEAKRTFQQINDGKPVVSDDLLGQVAGEALALRSSGNQSISRDNVIVIVVVKHYVKFFQFDISASFLASYKTLSTTTKAAKDMYANVESTGWLDASELRGRRNIVHHVLALVAWADSLQIALADGGDSNNDSEEIDEDDINMD